MKKELEVGKDYGKMFGLKDGQHMVYNGNISWTATEGAKTMTMDSQKMTDDITKRINQTATIMGSM